jgi:hypothetical protein
MPQTKTKSKAKGLQRRKIPVVRHAAKQVKPQLAPDPELLEAFHAEYQELWIQADPANLMAAAGYPPLPWQARMLRSDSDRILLLCGRQMGKSLTTACKADHRALYTSDSTIVLISRSQDQSDELFHKVMKVYDALGRPVPAERELASELILTNGSRIVALPNNPDTVRGYSDVDLLIVDEASRVQDTIMVSVLPMILASKGSVILLSTPNGPQGYFHKRWVDPFGKDERIVAKAWDHPLFDKVGLADLARELGPAMAAQELGCEFIQSDDQVFPTECINRAFASGKAAIPGF